MGSIKNNYEHVETNLDSLCSLKNFDFRWFYRKLSKICSFSVKISNDILRLFYNLISMKNTRIHTRDLPVLHHQVNQGQVVRMIKVTDPQPTGQAAMVVDRVLDLVQSPVNHKVLKIKHFYLANLKFG